MSNQSVTGDEFFHEGGGTPFSLSVESPSLIARLMRAAADLSEQRRRRREAAGNSAALSRLGDHTLYDIGIHRSQITSIARCMSRNPGGDCRRFGN